jgi:hypothetical protein
MRIFTKLQSISIPVPYIGLSVLDIPRRRSKSASQTPFRQTLVTIKVVFDSTSRMYTRTYTSSLNMLLRSVGLSSLLAVVPKLLCPLRCALGALSFARPGAVSTMGLGLAVRMLLASLSSPKGFLACCPPWTSSSYLLSSSRWIERLRPRSSGIPPMPTSP